MDMTGETVESVVNVVVEGLGDGLGGDKQEGEKEEGRGVGARKEGRW